MRRTTISGAALLATMLASAAKAQTPQNPPPPAQPPTPTQTQSPPKPAGVTDTAQVVSTKIPELPELVPVSVEVILGDELRDRGATTLRDALALAAGVEIAQGSDNGPAGSVPEFWGLREFDAFLLVVDGVPWGGAFNPALTTLNLRDVERIEVLRGAAPVTFGATSFVGVIHVVHKPSSFKRTYIDVHGASFRSGGVAADLPVQHFGAFTARVSADFDRQGFADERTSFGRGHAMFRASNDSADRPMWFLVDANLLRQSPASPHPRDGASLSTAVPTDANANPQDAFINDDRISGAFGFTRPFRGLKWTTTAGFSHSSQRLFRGFLADVSNTAGNADGLRENIHLFDLYGDSHFQWPERNNVTLVAGADYLHGQGTSEGATFSYTTPLNGVLPAVVTAPTTLDLGNEDRREFFGVYGLLEYRGINRLTITGGLRANVTFEERGGSKAEEAAAKAAGQKDHGQLNAQPTGSAGAIYRLWERNTSFLSVFGNYRGTFKPAAFDFGLGNEADGGIDPDKTLLSPETAQSLEGGVKSRLLAGRIDVEASAFRMDFHNLVTSTLVNGLPALQNTGKTRFEGFETAATAHFEHGMMARVTYSFHNGRFVDFVQDLDGTATQLKGNRYPMSARRLFSAGWMLSRERGAVANVIVKYTGNRFLNEENSALAGGFVTVDCGGGYRIDKMEFRFDLRNLTNRRDPTALSELGDSQFYLMPARSWIVSMGLRY